MDGYPPPAPKEIKSVPLYQHDQYPFPKRPVIEENYTQQQSTFQTNGDLQDVIFYYQSQPDLLRLILQSKLEEDKRRAEEAKLRSKELDLMMLQQQQQQRMQGNSRIDPPNIPATTTIATPILASNVVTPVSSTTTSNNSMMLRRPSPAVIEQPIPRHASPIFIHHPTTATAATTTTTARTSNTPDEDLMPSTPHTMFQTSSFPVSPTKPSRMMDDTNFMPMPPSTAAYHPLPPIQRYEAYFPQRPRRRREMQAITKIVETREYPYLDGYLWKNNGNTIQKKTGNKSVYYKCANSIKGCPVNKTVTWKGNSEYLIKYRGEHLSDCARGQQEQPNQHQHQHELHAM